MMSRFVVFLFALMLLVACGDGNPGNSNAYQSDTNYCSSSFVFAYNNVVRSFNDADVLDTKSSLDAARTSAVNFKSDYSGVVCKAELGGTPTMIDADAKMDSIITKIDSRLDSL